MDRGYIQLNIREGVYWDVLGFFPPFLFLWVYSLMKMTNRIIISSKYCSPAGSIVVKR